MLPVYLFALVVGLGVLAVQIALGSNGDADGDADMGHDLPAHDAGDGDGDGDGDGQHGLAKSDHTGDGGPLVFLLSTRFWVFSLLAFGFSGTLIYLFHLAGPIAGALVAAFAGLSSGAFAVAALRALRRSSNPGTAHAREAVGRTGRVLVAFEKGSTGKVRVVLKGQSVDLLAKTDEARFARGEEVLIEDIQGEVAQVGKRPPELM